MYIDNDQREIINKFIKRPFLLPMFLISKGGQKAQALREYMLASYAKKDEKLKQLEVALWKNDTKHITEVFEGRELDAMKQLLGEDYALMLKEVWDRSVNNTYTLGYARRSYRTKLHTELYLRKNIEKLEQFVYLAASGFSIHAYLDENKSANYDISVIADIIAVELDRNNEAVFHKIKEILYNDNNTAIVTREIIQGLLMSRNAKAHQMVGDLLLAAKLQEGLRQSIVESMDECSREGFVYMLKVILDNNLARFSSVVRAFGTWTGLGIQAEKPKVVNKCIETAYQCITDKAYIEECISSEDNQLIYIGLWAKAFDEVSHMEAALMMLFGASEKYKREVALLFLYETQFTGFKHILGCGMLEDNELEVAALAVMNLFNDKGIYSIRYSREDLSKDYESRKECFGAVLFNRLEKLLNRLPKKELEFNGIVFPWVNAKLSSAKILDLMMLSVVNEEDSSFIDKLLEYKDKMSVEARSVLVDCYMQKPANARQRKALLEFCGDRSASVRDSAFKVVGELKLAQEEYHMLEDYLQYKSGDLRKNAIKLLLQQDSMEVQESVRRLLDSSNENKRLAALDIINALETNKQHAGVYNAVKELATKRENVSQKEQLLTGSMMNVKDETRSLGTGLGLLDPKSQRPIPSVTPKPDFQIQSVLSMDKHRMGELLQRLDALIDQNRDYEYEMEYWDGSLHAVTLGGSDYLSPMAGMGKALSGYPISDQIREFAQQNKLDTNQLLQLNFCCDLCSEYGYGYKSYLGWFADFLDTTLDKKALKGNEEIYKKLKYRRKVENYLELLLQDCPKSQRFKAGEAVATYLFSRLDEKQHAKAYTKKEQGYYFYDHDDDSPVNSFELSYWLRMMKHNIGVSDGDDISEFDHGSESGSGSGDDEIGADQRFSVYFKIAYGYYSACEYKNHATLSIFDFGRAYALGIIDENEIYKELMTRPSSKENIRCCTEPRNAKDMLGLDGLRILRDNAVARIVSIEAGRGELDTEVTGLAASVNRCYGADIFTAIILNSEKDSYVRGYNFVSGDCTKRAMLSHLLKCCYPKDDDSVETLTKAIAGRKLTQKQLIEAAMYAPQWLDIVTEYLGYPGLKSACWYFHAHVNDLFSVEKEAIVARYSPIPAQDFRDGAFDGKWFMEAYETVGEKNFKLVYDSAKYIAGGGLHKRSQLFADAILGRLELDAVKNRIMDKRNKDYLLCYGLIPIQHRADLLERYEYIHQYMKESKQFGQQRQASEGRSAAIALLNLARNAGYSDVNRLSWNMETEKLDSIRRYLEPQKIDELELWLEIDAHGKTDLKCVKGGKALKDVPSSYKKHIYVQQLREVKKSLNDQYKRARASFEQMMEKGEEFEAQELLNLSRNPVLAPIVTRLVYTNADSISTLKPAVGDNDGINGDQRTRHGFLEDGFLVDFNGDRYKLEAKDQLVIAHPVHLFEAKAWSGYQKHIFRHQLVQPFKQVFRELYLPNVDELAEGTGSKRYAGHQVQPKKTLALLKTRGWLASYEEGLQKVYYKENIVARVYALADWFSPAEVEAPTLELVSFEDRNTGMPVKLKDIPKLVFSETMRDVDLVVSVAHVGGVDPEASMSTIEIRTVIVEELRKLLKLDNVKLKGSHAHIDGIHGEYTVHLGSGVVHMMGTGAIHILPVHSGHRGRIFLPFIDEDPRSAEILSKIILLAEDKKLKDPTVLTQIAQSK